MKHLKWIIVSVVMALLLAACAPAAPEEEPEEEEAAEEEEMDEEEDMEEEMDEEEDMEEEMPEVTGEGSIWVLLPDSASSARWETDDRRFFEEAFDAAGVDYTIVNAEGDARTQQTQAEQAITSGAKVIMMVNLDSGSGSAIIAAARDADVAVIDYDRLTIEGEGADVYVSFDNEQVGRTMADVLVPLINEQDDPQVVFLNGGPTDNNATLFRNGYYGASEEFIEAGDWTVVDDQAVPEWDNQQALTIFEQILTAANNDVTAVYAANDGLAGAVISAFESAGIDPAEAGIPISGQDATAGGIQNILAGDQAMTVYKPIRAEAFAAAEVAIALLNGDSIDEFTGGLTLNNGTNDIPFVALDPIAVTRDNINETVIADGFRTVEEVCVGDFEPLCEEFGIGEEAAGGADLDASEAEGSIWVLLPDSASSARWETDDRRFFEEAFDSFNADYTIVNAEGDARTQQTQAEQAITSGAEVILMVNLDSGSGAAIIAAAREAGVAVIDYDRLTIEGEGADVYVSFDNEAVGQTMADVLVPLINEQDDPQVVFLNGGPTDNNSTLFRNGYYGASEEFIEAGDWTVVDDQFVPEWDNQQALTIFEQILTAADNDVTAVFAANDGLAGAVISAFESAGIDPASEGIPVSGQDATAGGIQNILAGDQAMTVYKPIRDEAFAAAEVAVRLLLDEPIDDMVNLTIDNGTSEIPYVAIDPIAVTSDNVAETVIADGFRTWDEICVGDFEQFCPEDR